MSQLSVFIDATTNDYVLIEGTYKFSNELLTEIYTRLITPVGTYLFDLSFGCMLSHWIGNRQILTSYQINKAVKNAVQPTIEQGRAKQITSSVNTLTKKLLILTVDVIDSNNNHFQFTVPYKRNT